MSALATAIAADLAADPVIAGIVNGRITDRDIRRTGWERNSTYFDTDGFIRPSLMVDDAGDLRPPFGHTAEMLATVYVWGFAPRTTAGRTALDTLMARTQVLMHRWQDPDTGAMALPSGRLGQQTDDTDAVMDRVELSVSGVLAVNNF